MAMISKFHTLPIIIAALMLASCTTIPTPQERRSQAVSIATAHGWHIERMPAGPAPLAAFLPDRPARSDSLAIYIEGDGLAWIGAGTVSSDPTPLNPVALHLALAQPVGAAAYLGRPCQDLDGSTCDRSLWTERRFDPEVIGSANRSVGLLKERFGASRLTLVGYSGGAAVALLVAARRSDVDNVVTVAGNLDHKAWTSLHRIDPLRGSWNPADSTAGLRHVRQWHYAGQDDTVIPPSLVRGYASRFDGPGKPVVRVLPGFDHQCCWVQAWPTLWQEATAQ
jgi:hypothetical protein